MICITRCTLRRLSVSGKFKLVKLGLKTHQEIKNVTLQKREKKNKQPDALRGNKLYKQDRVSNLQQTLIEGQKLEHTSIEHVQDTTF